MMASPDHPVDPGGLARILESHHLQQRIGACESPVLMAGSRLLVDADTGLIIDRLDTGDLPEHTIALRCRNRRAAVCVACSARYKLDAYHLFAAGLRGGKNTPEEVATHPRLFATLTAPSFGKVHLGPDKQGLPRPCHPRGGCGRWHPAGDPAIGTPLSPDSYDYPGQVLFNALAGVLWARFATAVRRALAEAGGLSRRDAEREVKVIFAKVAEFQTRGVVHFHAIVRLDGPHGPGSPPPDWASPDLLETAIRYAAPRTTVTTVNSKTADSRNLGWGRQIDIQIVSTNDNGLPDVVVARYVAKYATKSTEAAGIDIRPIFCRACDATGSQTIQTTKGRRQRFCRKCAGTGRRPGVKLDLLPPHTKSLVETCWRLGAQPEYAALRLRRWAHQLGYHGHFATKSRTYSTTFTALRAERHTFAEHQRAQHLGIHPDTRLLVVGQWRYAGRETAIPRPPDLPHRQTA